MLHQKEEAMIQGIDHIELIVQDVETFIAFFQKMGCTLLTRTSHHGESAELQLPVMRCPRQTCARYFLFC